MKRLKQWPVHISLEAVCWAGIVAGSIGVRLASEEVVAIIKTGDHGGQN